MSLSLPRTVPARAARRFDQGAIKIEVLRVCGLSLGWAWAWGRRWGVGEMGKLGISLSPACGVLYLCEVVTSSCTGRRFLGRWVESATERQHRVGALHNVRKRPAQ